MHSVIVFVCLRARGGGVVIAAPPVSHMVTSEGGWGGGDALLAHGWVCVCQKDSNDVKKTNYSIQ